MSWSPRWPSGRWDSARGPASPRSSRPSCARCPAIRAAAAAEGAANITTARDSVVRGLPLLLQADGERLPSFALTVVARHARRPAVLDAEPAPGVVYAAGRAIPLAERNTMLINFLGPPSEPGGRGPFRILSFVDVLEGRFDPAVVRDRIVLIGPTIQGVDEHPTPTTSDTRMWGVEILANAVETILAPALPRPAAPGRDHRRHRRARPGRRQPRRVLASRCSPGSRPSSSSPST